MTFPASGAVKFSDINKELAQSTSTQINLNNLGSRIFPGKNVNTQIAMSNFYSKSNTIIEDVVDQQAYPSTAAAGITFQNNGTITRTGSGSSGNDYWFGDSGPSVTGVGNLYAIKFVKDSTASAWDAGLSNNTLYSLSTNRSVQWTQSGVGTKFGPIYVFIYDSTGTYLYKTSSMSVSVEVI